jgi:hypothetical protein
VIRKANAMSNDVNNPGTIDPADEVAGTGLPAQVPVIPPTTPSNNAGPVVEVEGQAFGAGVPQNITGNG